MGWDRPTTRQLVKILQVTVDRGFAVILKKLLRLEELLEHPPAPGGFQFNALGSVPRVQGGSMLEVTCTVAEKFRVQVMPVSNSGRTAKIQAGSLTVTAVDGSSVNAVAIVENDDTFSVQADLLPDTASTDQDFTVAGDADLGAGVVTISDTLRLHVTSEQATQLGLTSVGAVSR